MQWHPLLQGHTTAPLAWRLQAPSPLQQDPQLPCCARGCCCTLRPRLDVVSAAEVFPHPLPGPSRKSGKRISSRLLWGFSVPLLAVLSQSECVPVPGTEQCGDTEVAVAGWAGHFQRSQLSRCSELQPKDAHCLPYLFSLHLSPLESLLLCLLVLACFLPEIISSLLLSLRPTVLPQEQPCR